MKTSRKIFIITFILVIGFLIFRECSGEKSVWSGTYQVARSSNWTSLIEFSRQKNLQAFMQDLMQEVIEAEDLRLTISVINESSLIPSLDTEMYDGVFSSLLSNSYNQHIYIFSEPILLVGGVLVVPKNSLATSLEDMRGKIIGIASGSNFEADLAQYQGISIKLYGSVASMLEDIRNKQIDGIFIAVQDAWSYTRGIYRGEFKIVTSPTTDNGLRLVAKKNERGRRLVELFNQALQTIREDNTYMELLKKWELI